MIIDQLLQTAFDNRFKTIPYLIFNFQILISFCNFITWLKPQGVSFVATIVNCQGNSQKT